MYLDRFKLTGRVAVVTGGGQGIGLACVEALSEAGAHVTIADRDPRAADDGRAKMKDKGCAIDVIAMDVTDSAQVDAAAARVLKERGRIDVLVCSAGVVRPDTAAEEVSDADWLDVVNVNLNGVFWCWRSAGPCWRRDAVRSSTSARCPGSSPTSRNRRPITTRPRPPCIT